MTPDRHRLASTSLLLAACLAFAATAQAAEPPPQPGGTAVIGMTSEPPTINPAITAGAPDKLVGCMIYEGLVHVAAGFKIEPELAKSWDISPDGTRYTFHLADAKWQDGTPFTSKDVQFSLLNISAKYGPLFAASGRAIAAIDTPDPATAIITLSRPFGPFLLSLACDQNGGILPAHVFEGTDILKNPATLTQPMGTGPFKIAEWAHGDHIALDRNPTYRKPGRPYLDRIVLKFIPNGASRVLALQAGEIDYINEANFPATSYKTVTANKALQAHETGYYADFVLILNTHRPPLDNPKVRQALMTALDRTYITKSVFNGLGEVAQSAIDTRIAWAYNPAISYGKIYPYDPAKARAVLDEAGLKPGPDGTRFSIDLVYDSSRQEYGPLSTTLKQYWAAIGVKLNLYGSERPVELKRVYSDYDFGATLQNYGTSGDPALGIARLYVSSSIKQGATFNNASQYSNPQIDSLFAEGQAATTQEERAKSYHQIQTILAEDLPTIPLNLMGEYSAASAGFHNLFMSQDEPFWSEVWIEH